MVAELQLTDPLPELTVGSVLERGVSRSESYIFESSSFDLSCLSVVLVSSVGKILDYESFQLAVLIAFESAKIANNLSAIAEHYQKTNHTLGLDNIKILCREDRLIPRKVQEVIFIWKETNPTLNRDGGVNFQRYMIHF